MIANTLRSVSICRPANDYFARLMGAVGAGR
jgi:hypothetical protein